MDNSPLKAARASLAKFLRPRPLPRTGQSWTVSKAPSASTAPTTTPTGHRALRPQHRRQGRCRSRWQRRTARVQLYSNPVMPDGEALSGSSWAATLKAVPNRPAAASAGPAQWQQQQRQHCRHHRAGWWASRATGPKALPPPWANASRRAVLAYEQSLNGAMGTLFIFYDLSKRLTLRG